MCVDYVNEIPVCWQTQGATAGRTLVVWLPGFTGRKEEMQNYLADLAEAGFVALSFDPVDHGERSRTDPEATIDEAAGEFRAEINGHIYRHFWSILAHAAKEVPTVVDWAVDTLGVSPPIGIGGISMGGDIAVAAASLEHRIAAVSACLAAPDWQKPGSIYQLSAPTAAVQADYEQHNPVTNIEQYRHRPPLAFACARGDQVAPADGAERFIQALTPLYAGTPSRLQLTIEDSAEHEMTVSMWKTAIAWFERWL